MRWFYDLKIGTKLIISFILMAALTTIVGYLGVTNMGKIDKLLDSLYNKETIGIRHAKQANVDLVYFVRAQENFLLASTPDKRTESLKAMNKYEKLMKDELAAVKPLTHTEKGRELLSKIDSAWESFKQVNYKVITLAQNENLARDHASVELAGTEGTQKIDALDHLMTQLAEEKDENGKAAFLQSSALYAKSRLFMITAILIAVFIGIGLGAFISRIISKPIVECVKISNLLAEGHLDMQIDASSRDETGQLLAAMKNMVANLREVTTTAEEIASGNLTVQVRERSSGDKLMQAIARMVEGLKEVVANIQSAASQVMGGSQEISASAEQLSQGATEQSASVEEVSSSMEQMAANIKQNSDNAQQTEKIALKAAEDGRDGGKSVSETVAAMKEIAGKIGIIEEIARQTNLLALNAAIEAARAGEHGKGFAVVASEVRKLAERSQTAAAEINILSASSVQIAEKAGEMLTRMVPDIQRNADLVQEIAAASNEQSVGANQINKALQQLDQVVQQNAAASEEMATTSTALLAQAEQLQNTIAFFKFDGSSTASRRNSPADDKQVKPHKKQPALSARSTIHKTNGHARGNHHAGLTNLDLTGEVRADSDDQEFENY